MEQLRCHTAAEGHPYRGFTWGNRVSLWDQPRAAGIAIRDRIVEYYKSPPPPPSPRVDPKAHA